jgi:hypothetical protein
MKNGFIFWLLSEESNVTTKNDYISHVNRFKTIVNVFQMGFKYWFWSYRRVLD